MSVYKRHLQELSKTESDLVVDLSNFEFQDVIGKGGFGEVIKGVDKNSGKIVAIKQIFSQKLEGNKLRRYLGEIETMAKCNNFFLVPFVGFTTKPPYSIITEYMPNGALNSYTRSRCKDFLSGTQLTSISIGISFGMVHLHSLNIIHRDLKTGNILLDENFFPRICDFGIARFDDSETSILTKKIGTPNYMAPELITSNNYTNKVDVYAFAMILYEMSENVKPFQGLSVNDIFTGVVQKDKRPRFTNNTPPPLQKLIRKCWDRDPDVRPTFAQIFDEFSSGRVYFHETNKYEITKFVKMIKDNDALCHRGDDQSVFAIIEKQLSENTNQTQNNKNIEQNTYNSDEYYDEIEEEDYSSESDDPATNVLRDPTNSLFSKYLDYYSKVITTNQFSAFYTPISIHFKSSTSPSILKLIYNSCCTLMKRDKQFIPFFVTSKFFTKIPFVDTEVVDIIIECFSYLFIHYPKGLSQSNCKHINALFSFRPEKMLILHSYYAKQLLSLTNPWPILDNLMTIQRLVLKKGFGYLYISLFYYLIQNFPTYRKERLSHLKPIFMSFLSAKDDRTVETTYNCLSIVFGDLNGQIDLSKATKHLTNKELSDSVLSLLIRQNSIIPDEKLVSALIKVAGSSPKAWMVMLIIAKTTEGKIFLLKNNNWISYAKKHLQQVSTLFFTIFADEETRELASNSEFFINILKILLESHDCHNMKIATLAVRRAPKSVAFIRRLEENGIILQFAVETQNGATDKYYTNCLSFIDDIGRVCYSPSYLKFIPILTKLLSSQKFVSDAITAMVTLSFHSECSKAMKSDKLKKYFHNLASIEQYEKASKVFLKNLNSI
ncbi:TKL family protein kinase [Trichomonas vaginalis G3]|uniref:TKL family protein kinase n=1 Tax=Trichomonas vaginalis (strain ATCC PRA-98 / G3) TaxID=412133 RepID=A2E8X4_TRIV3|nr:protein kinase protein [Trichomonas vaginalis G3]EAY10858.1 TKL family protein kinase [Trichomonas vaginalis G3]KAI5482906.1 protein kinase protein [Trichomonas vaginalis G3]|eukprot:XP_001323081.1 TKL family protein kinase [Trichomonas vaginalis G3]